MESNKPLTIIDIWLGPKRASHEFAYSKKIFQQNVYRVYPTEFRAKCLNAFQLNQNQKLPILVKPEYCQILDKKKMNKCNAA